MSMKWLFGFAFLLPLFCAAPAWADGIASPVKIERITVTPLPSGHLEIEMTVTIALGNNEQFVANRCWFTDPKSKEVPPTVSFELPQAGKSATTTARCTIAAKANWNGHIRRDTLEEVHYMDATKGTWKGNFTWIYKDANGKQRELTVSKEVTVP
jgi:hypothetical protein